MKLFPPAVGQSRMSRVDFRGAYISGIRPVVFQNIASRLFIKIVQGFKVVQTPFTAQARGISEPGFHAFGHNHIVLVVDPPAGQQ